MIQVRDLCKSYTRKGSSIKVPILKDINIDFPNTGFVCILGQSGSGKTTLLNLIGGLDSYDSGDIIVDGISTRNFSNRELDAYRNNYTSFIFQDFNLIDKFNVFDNVKFSLEVQGIKVPEEKVMCILKNVGLEGKERHKINQLSGGEMQRVAIARALLKESKIILCDEPTGNLDSEIGIQIMNLLKEISKDKLVIMVTHNEDYAKDYADQRITLSDGETLFASNYVDLEFKLNPSERKLKKGKISNIRTAHLVTNNLLRHKISLIFSLIFLVIGLTCFSILESGRYFNVPEYITNSLENDKSTLLPINTSKKNLDRYFRAENIDNFRGKYSEYKSLVSVSTWGLLYQEYFSEEFLNSSEMHKYSQHVKNLNQIDVIADYGFNDGFVCGGYPVNNNEVMITDYFARSILKFKDSKYNRFEDIIGKQAIPNFPVVISGIIKTDYEYYFELVPDRETEEHIFNGKVETDYTREVRRMHNILHHRYNAIYYSDRNVENIYFESLSYAQVLFTKAEIANSTMTIELRINYLDLSNTVMSDGKVALNDNEILVSKDALSRILNIERDLITDYASVADLIGDGIDVTYYQQLEDHVLPGTYKIVGFYNGNRQFSNGGFITNFSTRLKSLRHSWYDRYVINFSLRNKHSQNLKLIKTLYQNNDLGNGDATFDSNLSSYIHIGNLINGVYIKISKILIISSIIVLLISVFILNNRILKCISKSKKEVGIYRSMGISRLSISKIYLLEALLITLVTSISVFIIVNYITSSKFRYLNGIISGNKIVAFEVIFVATIAALLSVLIPMIKIFRLDPVKIIKNENN